MNNEIFKPREETILELLEAKRCFEIPGFERTYTWDIDKSIDLIESISYSGSNRILYHNLNEK